MIRRNFIKSAALLSSVSVIPSFAAGPHVQNRHADKRPLKKALGFGMIEENLPLVDKFKLVKDAGFDGIEFNSPVDIPIPELLDARSKTGIEIPSAVNKDHWSKPLSDPDPHVRQACIDSVAQSLHDIKALGGDTVLVVPGVVSDKVSYEQAYNTSLDSIRRLIPHAESTGMHIGLENVWNNFLLSPVEARRFVDEINHPLIGWYFDIGNVLRYGWPEQWIRTLNSRIIKLHVKEFSRELMNGKGLRYGFDVDLLEGDNNWPVVMKAVSEINYRGTWITAEVNGGDRTHLKKLSQQMDKIISFYG
ncbi:MAG: sugar phosphate isomerase/epimerase [Tannerella sp.]|jgi:hexulose-6-phosphate isomerase|nr:sugar phosphate isomerase/epimerase [Tannerella sp.]